MHNSCPLLLSLCMLLVASIQFLCLVIFRVLIYTFNVSPLLSSVCTVGGGRSHGKLGHICALFFLYLYLYIQNLSTIIISVCAAGSGRQIRSKSVQHIIFVILSSLAGKY